jgi:hypothetical protein
MKQIFTNIITAAIKAIGMMFHDDLAVMSDEVREILSHKEDAKLYRMACDAPKPITVTFHNGNSLTLI